MEITNEIQLRKFLQTQILSPMVKSIAQNIVEEVRKYILENEPISTKTIRKYTTYDLHETENGYMATIYINDEGMQTEQQPYAYGPYSKFMSFGLKSHWDDDGGDGMSISYHLVEWLEETGTMQKKATTRSGREPHGNNPFPPIHMFKNVYDKLETEIPKWISRYARQFGIMIERG